MCGISLILSGVRIVGSDHYREHNTLDSPPTAQEVHDPVLLIDDLKAALMRRGPDNLGYMKILLWSKPMRSIGTEEDEEDKKEDLRLHIKYNAREYIISSAKPANTEDVGCTRGMGSDAEMELLGATLQLRGLSRCFQPLEDVSGNFLVYNGEIFGGIHVAGDQNDGQSLLVALGKCCSCECHRLDSIQRACCCNGNGRKSVPEILSTMRGPWALIYWQEKSKTIWFGRDAFGRRSLLVHWPSIDDSRFVLSSVSPPSAVRRDSDEVVYMAYSHNYWDELPCGIYSIDLKASEGNELCITEKIIGQIMKHAWTDSLLNRLVKWERTKVEPKGEGLSLASEGGKTELQSETNGSLTNDCIQSGCIQQAPKVLVALRESVMRRIAINSILETAPDQCKDERVPIALLFSGGLDSMILAALLDHCLDSRYIIDLLNVSFDGQLAPDRVSARIGLKELQKIAPARRWRLVEIDATLSSLTWETKHLMTLIHPSKTYMDLNIGIALWLAARGDGWVDGEICNHLQDYPCRYRYKSSARVLFVGSGADEQCAGYGRHKTKYRQGGWSALQEEMRLDMQRIWKRNLGRDDRCISDHGKEARFPFLDEDVIKTLLEIPLWEIAELDEPAGRGDKKILREVARLLGIEGAAVLPKRAIQFGSRIARESNRRTFGSNRAANQASAGSVKIPDTL